MHIHTLTVTDFRCLRAARVEFDPGGTTVVTGRNGSGKTSLLEAVGILATGRSFRGAAGEALVRTGSERAVVRAESEVGDRRVDVAAEVGSGGRIRVLVNGRTTSRRSELHEVLQVTVFSPEDVDVVRGGPSGRRRFLDDALATADGRLAAVADDVERILRQRGALLRQAGGHTTPDIEATLDVWDDRLAGAGTALVAAREGLVDTMGPLVAAGYAELAGASPAVGLRYRRSYEGELADALARSRREDVRRGVSTMGPHRDELELELDAMPARTHASQGEQRTLALALRLAAHRLATARLGSSPVLLLDDVFSELDLHRSRALLEGLPPGQTLITTAVGLPAEVRAGRVYELAGGVVLGTAG